MAFTSIGQAIYFGYRNRDRLKKVSIAIIIVFGSIFFFLYLVIATVFAVIQGTGNVVDNAVPETYTFSEFQQFSYKTFYGEKWYDFIHPYYFPTLGVLTQGVILDSSAKVGKKHIAWDIADRVSRQTEVKAFADGMVIAVKDNILYNTTRRWKLCDEDEGGVCWYEVKETADVQIGCGYEVIIEHADSLRTQYCHLTAMPLFNADASVTLGQTIGNQGSTGWATGKHLHFALSRDGQQIDPSYAFLQTSLSNWEE